MALKPLVITFVLECEYPICPTRALLHLWVDLRAEERVEPVFDRYRIVNEADLAEGLGRLAEASSAAGEGPKVVPIRRTGTTAVALPWAAGAKLLNELVAWDGIEPPTRGFSVRCSTS
jgi:hypothetical protein